MKKFIASAILAPLAAAAVDVQSANTVGVVKIESTLANTVIAQPYAAVGGGTMKVVDFVLTDGLQDGDILYYFVKGDGSTVDSLKYWVLANGAWTAATVVQESVSLTPDSSVSWAADTNQTIARGSAVIVSRQKPVYTETTEDHTKDAPVPFYIYGEVASGNVSQTISPGRNLVAYPKAEALDLNTSLATGPVAGDKIVIPLADGRTTEYTYMDNPKTSASDVAWYKITLEVDSTTGRSVRTYSSECTVPAGQGFWYVRGTGSGNFTVEW